MISTHFALHHIFSFASFHHISLAFWIYYRDLLSFHFMINLYDSKNNVISARHHTLWIISFELGKQKNILWQQFFLLLLAGSFFPSTLCDIHSFDNKRATWKKRQTIFICRSTLSLSLCFGLSRLTHGYEEDEDKGTRINIFLYVSKKTMENPLKI